METTKPKFELGSALKRLLKVLTFTVLTVEDESTPNATVFKVTVADSITGKGSNVLPDGSPMEHTSNEIYVAEEDIEKFNAGCEEVDGKVVYKGALKLDVSRPKFRVVNGKAEAITPAKLWLTSTTFRSRGAGFRSESRDISREAIMALFGRGSKSVADTKATTGAGEKLEPQDTKAATAKK